MVNVGRLLKEKVGLVIECIDRIYLNGYVPNLQVGGQVVNFLCSHRGKPVPSPALLGAMTKDFVRRVEAFAASSGIPMIPARKGERKEDLVRPYVTRARREDKPGVVAIVVAQERSHSFRGFRLSVPGAPRFGFHRVSVNVKQFYFYVFDNDFGPAFIKVSTYFPYPVRVCVNGHEWLKRHLDRFGIAYTPLDNGIAAADCPARAQALADRLGANHIEAFFYRWMVRLPWPLTKTDRRAGYLHRLSILQFEHSLTAVFATPLDARRCVEGLIRDNLDLGRPAEVAIIFGRRITKRTPGTYRTRLVDRDGMASLQLAYKDSCRVKEYLKEGRALRIETTINDPTGVGILKSIRHLPELVALCRSINRRMLDVQRVAQQCIPETARFEQVCLPSTVEGLRTPGLRFGDRLVLGLLGALSLFCHVPEGLTNRGLRKGVHDLCGIARTSRQTSYDLKRLRLNGLIVRIPGTNTYEVTDEGRVMAAIYTRTFDRVIGVAEHAMTTVHDCPHPISKAWKRLDREFARVAAHSRLREAA